MHGRTVEACFDCAQICTGCADACLAEEKVAELTTCIRTNLDCADLCVTTGNILSRRTGYDTKPDHPGVSLKADTEGGHAQMHEHCKVCAEVCRRWQQACTELLDSLG